MTFTNEWIEERVAQGRLEMSRDIVRRMLASRPINASYLVLDRLEQLTAAQLSTLVDELLDLQKPFNSVTWADRLLAE